MSPEIEKLVQKLKLLPHPEGGYYAETYRSTLSLVNLPGFEGPRSSSTGIYFLLTKNDRSHLHRIKSDEMWHFYSGNPLKICMIDSNGNYAEKTLGPNIGAEESFQFTVPAGTWFGAEVQAEGSYSLVGCTVSPGFDFSDFELANKNQMIQTYPQHREFLDKFCVK